MGADEYTNSAPVDATPPAVSQVGASSITTTTATINWTTNEAADSQVEYGPSTSYGSLSTLATSLLLSHAVTLTGLTADTLYHYRIRTRDAAGNLSVSGDFTFHGGGHFRRLGVGV